MSLCGTVAVVAEFHHFGQRGVVSGGDHEGDVKNGERSRATAQNCAPLPLEVLDKGTDGVSTLVREDLGPCGGSSLEDTAGTGCLVSSFGSKTHTHTQKPLLNGIDELVWRSRCSLQLQY